MTQEDFDPKLGRIRGARRGRAQRYATLVFRQAGKHALRRKVHVSPELPKRGMAAGARAAAGLIAPGSRRVLVKARYTPIAGDLGAARAHLRYVVRDGVTRKGRPGRLYDASGETVDARLFLDRSENDPYQFRFVISAEEGAQLSDLKPFIRDLVGQMERDLDTKLDWVAADHFNTGHPHTHIVIRGRDDQGKNLVMARDYIAYGVRARAQSLLTLELGPESELERLQKLFNEIGQERLTRLDRALVARAKNGILVITSGEELDPTQQTLRVRRLETLDRLGLAEQRQPGVWALDPKAEDKLRQLGARADKFKMMQRALREAGIERGAAAMALFERGARKPPLIGRIVGVGLVDEISDHTWVVVDAVDGRVHYAELGRLGSANFPVRGSIVALVSDSLKTGRPSPTPRLQELSPVRFEEQIEYNGPTWLDQAIVSNWRPEAGMPGFAADLQNALAARGRWLAERQLAQLAPAGVRPEPHMMRDLREAEMQRIVQDLCKRLNATFIATPPGNAISGIYDHSIATPTGKIAVVRRGDTFTLAPWKSVLEPMRGRLVTGLVGPTRVTWTLDRGRSLPGRT